jgi:hypothetical protein
MYLQRDARIELAFEARIGGFRGLIDAEILLDNGRFFELAC